MTDNSTSRNVPAHVGRLLLFVTLLAACNHHPDRDPNAGECLPDRPAIASEADLARVIAKLNQPKERIQAFADLLAFADPMGYVRTGNLEADGLHEKANEAVRNCPDLEATVTGFIGQLERKESRMQAMLVLIQFAGPELYQQGSVVFGGTGDAKFDGLRKRAAAAVHQCADVDTVGQALDSPDRSLQFWGVTHFGSAESTETEQNPWVPLLPKLERLAVEADANIRSMAHERLKDYPTAHDFITRRVELETSPEVLMRLMRDREPLDQFNKVFVDRLCALLCHADERVRRDALLFIGFNSGRAPVWQFNFDEAVLDRVLESTRSPSAQERSAATYALTETRRLDLDRSREAFIRLAKDTSSDVRWRVGFGLSDQFDREDVKSVIAALLQDEVPVVRYMTVLAVGAEKHITELQELARCPDRQIAGWATEKLKQLEQRR